MALTILKKGVVKTALKIESLSALAALIDEVGPMVGDAAKTVAKIKALTESLKTYKEKIKALNDLIDALGQYGDDVVFIERGTKYEVHAGVREKSREVVDLAGIRKKLGDKVFFDIAKVTLKDIDKYIAAAEQAKLGLVKTSRTSRAIVVIPRHGAV
jgi:hypothetical protein